MKRIQEWLLFGIQLIVKMGFLGKYKLVSTATPEPDNKQGLKTLEKTILSLGKKNDTLNETLTSAKYEIAIKNWPNLFRDYTSEIVDGFPVYSTKNKKV